MLESDLYRKLLNSVALPANDGCWEWTGARNRAGYGTVYVDGKREMVHRAMWAAVHGANPKGKIILHRCDNPKCCRPDHLQVGTRADNNRDRDAKGRTVTRRKQRFRALHTAKVDNADLWAEVCSPESHDFDGISIG